MSDIRSTLEQLGTDVSPFRLRSAEEVRRDADRGRRRIAVSVVVPVAAALLGAAVLVPGLLDGREDGASVAVTSPSPSPREALPASAWLPSPWRVTASQPTSLAAAAAAGDTFCDVRESFADVPAVRQDLSDGKGSLRVYGVAAGSFERASDLFKMLYAQCGQSGPVASEPGPALYWGAPSAPSAALWDDSVVYLVGPVRSAAAAPPDLRAVLSVLVDTVGKPCDATMAGKACPPSAAVSAPSASP